MTNVTAKDLMAMRAMGEKMVILDVRMPGELKAPPGQIEGAVNIPLQELPGRYNELKPDDKIVVVCRSGGRSAQGSQFLASKGFRHIYNLEGGMEGYSAVGGK